LQQFIQEITRWLMPGMGVKRWLFLLFAGAIVLGFGVALFLFDASLDEPGFWLLPTVRVLSLQFLPRLWRLVIFGGAGIGLVLWGLWGLNRSLLRPFLRPGRKLVDELSEYRRRERGPRVVVIGGGHGLATVLRGLKEYTHNLTAVVSVADDGGSSGKLRQNLGILPPGDIRNCLAALSSDEDLLTQLFQYRFGEDSGLSGHSFGNLFISALVDITGSFEDAIAESGRVLSVHGRVLPSTLHNVRLLADVELPDKDNEVRVEGESRIPLSAGRVRRVWLEPNNAAAYPPVIQAVLSADMIIIGPGSLYTSILPNILIRDLLDAIASSRALKIFITNIAMQSGETDAYTCDDHIQALEQPIGRKFLDIIVCNDNHDAPLANGIQWVRIDDNARNDKRIYSADLLDVEHPWRHDANRLAQVLMDLFNERTGPLT